MSEQIDVAALFERRISYPDPSAKRRLDRLVGIDDNKVRLSKILGLLVNRTGLEKWANTHHPEAQLLLDTVTKRPPLVILAGKEYGSGSSRDWAAKGTKLLGVRAVIAESYERIHRSNLVGMGVLPLQFNSGVTAMSLKLTGEELFEIGGLVEGLQSNFAGVSRLLTVNAKSNDGTVIGFHAICRIDTPQEVLYYQHGGILPYVLRQLAK